MGLAITKRVNESFWIGPDIEIAIVEVSGTRVRLCVTAPANIKIGREERPKSYIPVGKLPVLRTEDLNTAAIYKANHPEAP